MRKNQTSESAGLRNADQIRMSNLRSTREQILYLLVFLLFVSALCRISPQGRWPIMNGRTEEVT